MRRADRGLPVVLRGAAHQARELRRQARRRCCRPPGIVLKGRASTRPTTAARRRAARPKKKSSRRSTPRSGSSSDSSSSSSGSSSDSVESESAKFDSGKFDSGKSDSGNVGRRATRQVGLRPSPRRFRRMQAEIGIFGGSGFYSSSTTSKRRARHAVRRAERAGHDRRRRRPAGRLHSPPRPRPRVRAGARSRPGRTCGRCACSACTRSSGRARRVAVADVHPGDFVVLDQLVDRTWGRPDTFYDAGDAHHVSYADPYCPVVSRHVVAAGRARRRAHARARHGRRDPRTALLDARRVALGTARRAGTS